MSLRRRDGYHCLRDIYQQNHREVGLATEIGFIPHAPESAFAVEEWSTLLRRGRRLSDLASRSVRPATMEEETFVACLRGQAVDGGDLLDLWHRYLMARQTPLTVELVPRTTWFSNVRSAVRKSDWDRLRRAAYRAAGDRCEVCGGRGGRHPVEAHEVFVYDDLRGVQRLERLQALCPACHGVKHIGRSMGQGRLVPALRHLGRVNGWSPADAEAYTEVQFEVWARRSSREWDVDLDWLSGQGVPVRG